MLQFPYCWFKCSVTDSTGFAVLQHISAYFFQQLVESEQLTYFHKIVSNRLQMNYNIAPQLTYEYSSMTFQYCLFTLFMVQTDVLHTEI